MQIAGLYSFNDGQKKVQEVFPHLLEEVYSVISEIDASKHLTKISKEKTMKGKVLFSPSAINANFKAVFAAKKGWEPIRVQCDYHTRHYAENYFKRPSSRGAFREMDFVKDTLGIEVQFGKYAFMVYNVCAKMTIFHKLGHITHGIEIVPVKSFANQMSTGVSYFEQFVWDLEHRGVSNIDIPVLILGIDAD